MQGSIVLKVILGLAFQETKAFAKKEAGRRSREQQSRSGVVCTIPRPPRTEFAAASDLGFSFSATDIFGQVNSPLSYIPGLYPLGGCRNCDRHKYLQALPGASWGQSCPQLRCSVLEAREAKYKECIFLKALMVFPEPWWHRSWWGRDGKQACYSKRSVQRHLRLSKPQAKAWKV